MLSYKVGDNISTPMLEILKGKIEIHAFRPCGKLIKAKLKISDVKITESVLYN